MANFKKLMNQVPLLLLSSPLHGVMSKQNCIISFTGRKSGKAYRTPVGYRHEGDVVDITTDSPWWRNFTDGATVQLRIKGKDYRGTAEAITDEEQVVGALAAMVRAFPSYGKHTGVAVEANGEPDMHSVREAVREGRVLVRVKLEQPVG